MAWSGTHTTTTLAKWIPKEWGAEIEPYATPVLVAAGMCVDWPFPIGVGTVYPPKMSAIAAAAMKTDGSDEDITGNTEDYATMTSSPRQSSVFIPWGVGNVVLRAHEAGYQAELARSCRVDGDARILEAAAAASTHAGVVTDATVTKPGLLLAKQTILGSDGEMTGWGVFDTTQYANFFNIQGFVDAAYVGSGNRMETGRPATVLGLFIIFTTQVYYSAPNYYNIVSAPRGMVHGTQAGLTVTIDEIPTKGHGRLIMAKYQDGSAILNDKFIVPWLTQ